MPKKQIELDANDKLVDDLAEAMVAWMGQLHKTHWAKAKPLQTLVFKDFYDGYLPQPHFKTCKGSIGFSFADDVPKPTGRFNDLLDSIDVKFSPSAFTVGNLIFMIESGLDGFEKFDLFDGLACHEIVHALQFYMLGVWAPDKSGKINEGPLKPWAKGYIFDYIVKYINPGRVAPTKDAEHYASIRFESPAVALQKHYMSLEDYKGKDPPPQPSAQILKGVRGSLESMSLKINK